jgi:hypothetical protein
MKCFAAIKAMQDGKSPGSDGLLKDWAQSLYYVKTGNMPKTSIIGGHAITLLNVDFKIVSRTLVNRLKNVVHQIIGPEQTSGLPNIDPLLILCIFCEIRSIIAGNRTYHA